MGATRKKIAELLGNSERTVEAWEKDGRHIILFIRRYLDSNELVDEFIHTQKIEKFENIQTTSKKNDLDEHILFHAIQKVKKIPDLFLLGKKEFWLKGFLKAVESSKVYSKKEFIQSILNLRQTLTEAKKWKKMTAEWAKENLSEYEVQLIMLNKDKVIRELNV